MPVRAAHKWQLAMAQRSICLLGWHCDPLHVIMHTKHDATKHAGSTVTFLLKNPPKAKWPTKKGNCRFNFEVAEGGNPTLPKVCSEFACCVCFACFVTQFRKCFSFLTARIGNHTPIHIHF